MSQVLLPVDDLTRSLEFYERLLNLEVTMRDGDRYATLGAGPVKIALAAPAERLADRGTAMSFKVESLDDVVRMLTDAGFAAPEIIEGHHERSAEIKDPDGHAALFYEPR